MFIRKRLATLKNGGITVSYQAVESYRRAGKVRQRVVSLGEHPNPRDALGEELRYLDTALRCSEYPLSEWGEVRHSPGGNPYRVKLSEKQAFRKKEFWQKIYERHSKRVGKLESVVSKYSMKENTNDTAYLKKEESKALANFREIRRLMGNVRYEKENNKAKKDGEKV